MRLYLEKTHHKKRAGRVPQGVGLSSSPGTAKEKKRRVGIGKALISRDTIKIFISGIVK
jgi:hypothetical protein